MRGRYAPFSVYTERGVLLWREHAIGGAPSYNAARFNAAAADRPYMQASFATARVYLFFNLVTFLVLCHAEYGAHHRVGAVWAWGPESAPTPAVIDMGAIPARKLIGPDSGH